MELLELLTQNKNQNNNHKLIIIKYINTIV